MIAFPDSSNYELMLSEHTPLRSNPCMEKMKMYRAVGAIVAVVLAEAAFALFSFDESRFTGGALNARVYDYTNLVASAVFLLGTVARSEKKLKDLAGSYEFLAVTLVTEAVMYGVVFFQTPDRTDFTRSVIWGLSLGMTAASLLIAILKHCTSSDFSLGTLDSRDAEENQFLAYRRGFQ